MREANEVKNIKIFKRINGQSISTEKSSVCYTKTDNNINYTHMLKTYFRHVSIKCTFFSEHKMPVLKPVANVEFFTPR